MDKCVHMWKPSLDLLVLPTMPLLAAIILIRPRQVQHAFDDGHAEQKPEMQVDKQATPIHLLQKAIPLPQLTELVAPLHQITELALLIHQQLTESAITIKLQQQRLAIPLNIQLKEFTMPTLTPE